jgi:hypothetical protein
MRDQIQLIQEKLILLRDGDRMFQILGSQAHKYQLNPCMSADHLRSVEGEIGIRLPDGDRRFLLVVGNGGAGPYYGLIPLEEAIAESKRNCRDNGATDYPLAKAFPFAAPMDLASRLADYPPQEDWLVDEYLSAPPRDAGSMIERFTIRWDFYSAHAAAMQELESQALRTFSARYHVQYGDQGYLKLSDFGCGIYCLLPLSGDERGQVWVYPNDDFIEFYPLGQSFLDWYEHWLDSSLQELQELRDGKNGLMGQREV